MGKGKTEFTRKEYEEIRSLISQLEIADSVKKKNIRSKIRNIGLFWSEIASGIQYTVDNFDLLIQQGIIRIIEDRDINIKLIQSKDNEPLGKKSSKINNRVFISYKRKDKEPVFNIKEKIENSLGEICWIDLDGIESDAQFVSVIIKAIKECEIFLFMYSNTHTSITDFDKDWTVRELQYAEKQNKKIVFVNLDRSKLSDYFDFMYGQKQQVDAESEEALERLFADLKNWLGIASYESKNFDELAVNKSEGQIDIKEETELILPPGDRKKEDPVEVLKKDSLPSKKKKSNAFNPKENEQDKKEFNLLKDIFPPTDYSYDYIVSGVTIKKNFPESRKTGVVSLSECKRGEEGKIICNLYFLPMSKHIDFLSNNNIDYSIAWNGVPFVRNVSIEEGKEIIKRIFDEIHRIISAKTGGNKMNKIVDSSDKKISSSFEIREVHFSISKGLLDINIEIYSSKNIHQNLMILCGEHYFHRMTYFTKNKVNKIVFSIKPNLLPLTSGKENILSFKIQILKKDGIITEKECQTKVYYEKHLFSKNILEIRK